MLRAVSDLGTDRGINYFERIAFAKRFGDTYISVPAGRTNTAAILAVGFARSAETWLRRIRRAGSPSLTGRANLVDRRALELLSEEPAAIARWLLALADAELAVARRPASRATNELTHISPLAGLHAGAATSLPDATECRLALALAAVGRARDESGLRQLLEPVVTRDRWRYAWSETTRLGPPLERPLDLLIDLATRSPEEIAGVAPAQSARLGDVQDFVSGATDDRVLVRLAFALTLCPPTRQPRYSSSSRAGSVDRLYAVTRLASGRVARRPGGDEVTIRPVPQVIAALGIGDAERATRAAVGRLRSDGLAPYDSLDQVRRDPARCRRVAAALSFPLHPSDRAHLERAVLPPVEVASTEEGETR